VANGERISLNELLEVMKRVTGKVSTAAVYESERQGDVKHSQADNTRARDWFGYEKLIGLEDGIRQTIEWWRTSRFAR
jgi:nucleoside-diphosphate-sugar epimerase